MGRKKKRPTPNSLSIGLIIKGWSSYFFLEVGAGPLPAFAAAQRAFIAAASLALTSGETTRFFFPAAFAAGAFGAAAAATGTATGTFTYSEVGYFRFGPAGVYDDTFTAIDQSTDCTNDFSNTAVGGKYGCKFGNAAATPYFGRFIPDHFAVTPGSPVAACTVHPAVSGSYTPVDFSYWAAGLLDRLRRHPG